MRPADWRPPRWLVAGYLLVALLVATGAATMGHAQGSLDVDVTVDCVDVAHGVVDEGDRDRVTRTAAAIALEVTNRGPTPVAPVFRVPSRSWHIQNAWVIRDGPAQVGAGETARYVIAAPGDRARPALVDNAAVLVTNAGTQQRAAKSPLYLGRYDRCEVDA